MSLGASEGLRWLQVRFEESQKLLGGFKDISGDIIRVLGGG